MQIYMYMAKKILWSSSIPLISLILIWWIYAQSVVINNWAWWNNYCGDGVFMLMLWEECDDWNYLDWDGCSSNCMIEVSEKEKSELRMMPKGYTGSLVKRSETLPVEVFTNQNNTANEWMMQNISMHNEEICDEWILNWVVCTPWYDWTCTYCSESCELQTLIGSSCWDGVVDIPEEECDDKNFTNGDWCSASCKKEEINIISLSWSRLESIKEVDEKNEEIVTVIYIDSDSVPSSEDNKKDRSIPLLKTPTVALELPVYECGNNVIELWESCDDWNLINWDGCNFECEEEIMKEVVIIKKTQARQQQLYRKSEPKSGVWYTQPLPKSLSQTWAWFFIHFESILVFWISLLFWLLCMWIIRKERLM